ncbi:MAG: hypothetical protein AAGF01_28060, partial [Cyanobacteria bacterium P01_G01_bin.38]
ASHFKKMDGGTLLSFYDEAADRATAKPAPPTEAELYAPKLRDFWAAIAGGDAVFEFPEFPKPLQQYFHHFSALDPAGNPRLIDNQATLKLVVCQS